MKKCLAILLALCLLIALVPVIANAEAREAFIINTLASSNNKSIDRVQNLKLTGTTKSSLTIQWGKVDKAKKYVIEYKKSSENQWLEATASCKKTQYKITKLAAGTEYDIRVCAVNGKNKSEYTTIYAQLTKGKSSDKNLYFKGIASDGEVIKENNKRYNLTLKPDGTFVMNVYDKQGKHLEWNDGDWRKVSGQYQLTNFYLNETTTYKNAKGKLILPELWGAGYRDVWWPNLVLMPASSATDISFAGTEYDQTIYPIPGTWNLVFSGWGPDLDFRADGTYRILDQIGYPQKPGYKPDGYGGYYREWKGTYYFDGVTLILKGDLKQTIKYDVKNDTFTGGTFPFDYWGLEFVTRYKGKLPIGKK